MSKHTPGPWIADDDFPAKVTGKSGEVVAEVFGRGPGTEDANARLIAAAPDMLAACEGVLEWWRDHQYDTYASEIDGELVTIYNDEPAFVAWSKDAIAKATGNEAES